MSPVAIYQELEAEADDAVVETADSATENSNGPQETTEDAFGLADESDDDESFERICANAEILAADLAEQGVSFSADAIESWEAWQWDAAREWIMETKAWLASDSQGVAEGEPPAKPDFLKADRIAADVAAVVADIAGAAPVEAAPTDEIPAATTTAPAARPAAPMSDPDFELALQIVSADREIIRYTMVEAELKDRLKDVKKSLEGAVSERMELQRAQQSRERDLARGQGMLPFGKSGMATGGFSNGPASVGVVTADGHTQQFSSTVAAADFIVGDAKEKLAAESGMNEADELADAPAESTAPTSPTPADPGKTAPVASLDITKGQVEKLEEQGINTVCGLEEFMSAGKLQYVKGFGDKAIDRISDALFAWRQTNPIPTPAGEE